MIHASTTQKSSAGPWFIFLALLLIIPGCGGGTGEDQLEDQLIVGQPEPAAPADYSLKLAWDAPATNVDGSPLPALAGYKVYYGTASGVFANESALMTETTFSTPLLPQGKYYFAVKAFDIDGKSSDYSSPASGLCVNVSATPTLCPS